MEDFISVFFGLICPVLSVGFFLLLGLLAGGYNERSHLKRLDEREAALSGFTVTQTKSFFSPETSQTPSLMTAEVVIANDYLKAFLSTLRKFFGGELKSYQTLLTRARREALVRMMEDAQAQGYNALCNVRLNPVDLTGSATNNKQKTCAATIIGSATAYKTDLVPIKQKS